MNVTETTVANAAETEAIEEQLYDIFAKYFES